jgi:hypothetical protein
MVAAGVERGDFVARAHDFARGAVAQVERVQNEVAPDRRAARRALRRRQDERAIPPPSGRCEILPAKTAVRRNADLFEEQPRRNSSA